ncbi:suppressor of tumorigenicity 7 protein isoform 1 [Cricetulus griseus]|nr:suppressor of tumorigenicity 7 protein isoform 1 [Cricetulus griseus]
MADGEYFAEAARAVGCPHAPVPGLGLGPPLGWKERLKAGLANSGSTLWFLAGLGLLYALRVPLRLCDNVTAVMQKAWRERNPPARIKAAYQALELNNDCATAYVLLAEEEATTIVDAERLFKQALRAGEIIYRRSQQCQHQSPQHEAQLRRDTNVLVYIKRRLAMCARKLGRIREAVKIMRDLMKEFPPLTMLNIHENLLESLLELQAYADVQAVLAKYDDISLPKSAAICYTAALLKTRTVSDKFSPETASRRGLSTAEINAVEAIHRAVEFNPHVPKYLLEMKSLILPPEHILKRGDSEAIAYAFFHLQHWKRIEGALNLLQCTWEGTFRMIPYPLEKGHLFYPYPSCTETADRELLPTFHHVSVYPKKELPFFIHFTAGLCSSTAMIAFLTHQFPEVMAVFAKAVSMISRTCVEYLRGGLKTEMTLTNIIAVQSLPAPTHASYVKQRPKVLLTLGLIQGTLKYMHWVQCTTSIYALFESGVRKLNKEAGLDAICHYTLYFRCVQPAAHKKLVSAHSKE